MRAIERRAWALSIEVKGLLQIARKEGRSVAQICERPSCLAGSTDLAFLWSVEQHGTKFLERMLGRVGTKPAD
jgi:hypothetical protein